MSASVRSIALAILLLAAGLAASLAGIIVGETYRIATAKLAGHGLMALCLVGAYFMARGARPADAAAAAPSRKLGQAALLVVDGVVLTLVGVGIAQIDDAPGAALIGFVVLLADLAAASVVVWRSRRLAGVEGPQTPNRGLAALLAFNGVMLMLAFWMLGQYLDPPGAPGIGALFLAANLIVAILVVRRK